MTVNRTEYPAGGRDWDDLHKDMTARTADDVDWRGGRTPLYVFYNDAQTYEIGRKAYFEFFSENALGQKRAFKSIQSMEREVLDYGMDLFSAPAGATGAFTTGGSESIFIAMKSARDAHRAKTGAKRGEILNIVMPDSAHPAFDKAAAVMDLDIRRAPLRSDMRVDAPALKDLIDDRTIAIVGSAPCFPHGVVDPIEELSQIALDADVWMHVDACVGGWLAPFFTRIGRATPDFDFRFPGVRSLSADLHKFGFCPKAASTVFFRSGEDLDRSRFRHDAWPSGVIDTATLVGTRTGGSVASAWAVLNHLGKQGYTDAARRAAAMTDGYVEGIRAIDGLKMHSEPDLTLINFGSDEFDIFLVAEQMTARGWLAGLTSRPKGMHAMMSMLHEPSREQFLADLRDCVEIVRSGSKTQSDLKAVY
jgi:glutamate/tyrosine decarboxylase-like PLP-dependent enzyme